MSANIKEEDYETVDKLVDEAVLASRKSRPKKVGKRHTKIREKEWIRTR